MTWIGVDFDGTLVENAYPGVGKPVASMVAMVRAFLEAGHEVRIFTNRADREDDSAPVREFCKTHFGRTLRITATKDRECARLYDDIAVQVKAGRVVADVVALTEAERSRMETTHNATVNITPFAGSPEVMVCMGCGMDWPCPGRRLLDASPSSRPRLPTEHDR